MTEESSAQVWKVGSLASATGLTVRTLHHYDHIALVSPSGTVGTPALRRVRRQAAVSGAGAAAARATAGQDP